MSEIKSLTINETKYDSFPDLVARETAHLHENSSVLEKLAEDPEGRLLFNGNEILNEYAKKSDIPDVSNFITEIPAEYITETELNDKGYLTEHQSLTDYAKKEDIPDVTKFITEIPEEYVTNSELNEKGYLTEHQSLEGKADKEHTHPEYLTEHQSLEGLATEDYVDTKVTLFHATLDPVTTQYIKDSGDFTYADVVSTENCKIEATFGNVKILLNKEVHRNIEPDPVAGRYVEFSALLRNGYSTVKVFLFVYDPKNLPTDPASVAALENWGDSQYCAIAVQHLVIGDFLDNNIEAGKSNTINAPSTKATYDAVKFVYDLVMPVAIYDDPTGFEANDKDIGSWQLTGLNLAPYKRVKFYIKAAEDGNTGSPSHIVELHLDDRAKNAQGHFTGGHTAVFPDATSKFHNVICSVSGDKTAVAFNRANRYSASTAATSSGGRRCYLIEGYYI